MKHQNRIITLLLLTIIMQHNNKAITTTHIPQNIFGTDGVRATIGTPPFTESELPHLGYAIGQWIITTYGSETTVIIGYDTRISCPWVASCIKSGLLLHHLHIIDVGIIPTPAIVQLAMQHTNNACGIIISASHNPFQDNGIKIVTNKNGKLSAEDELCITKYFHQVEPSISYSTLGDEQHAPDAQKSYIEHIQSFFPSNFLHGKKIVLDCAHGATYHVAPLLFTVFGAEVIIIGNKPTGTNINQACGATNIALLTKTVLEEHADIGFAFDGDGDRIIAVNRYGEPKDGDAILALLLHHPLYKQTKTVIGTVMSNKGFENWLTKQGYQLLRTPVGDKYIAQAMEHDKELLIGGEQSGHIILRDYLPTGDGIFTALRIMETIILEDNLEMNYFTAMPQRLINLPVIIKRDLSQEPFVSMLKNIEQEIPNGRIIVRFSGTELKLRIMIEDNDEQLIESIGKKLVHLFQKELRD